MSALEVAEQFAAAIGDGYRFAVVNFANPDMVGHTGSIPAVIAAVETVDRCLGHGRRGDGARPAASVSSPPTTATPSGCSRPTASARTRRTRRTPCRSCSRSRGVELRDGGALADLAPTVLDLLGLAGAGGDDRTLARCPT